MAVPTSTHPLVLGGREIRGTRPLPLAWALVSSRSVRVARLLMSSPGRPSVSSDVVSVFSFLSFNLRVALASSWSFTSSFSIVLFISLLVDESLIHFTYSHLLLSCVQETFGWIGWIRVALPPFPPSIVGCPTTKLASPESWPQPTGFANCFSTLRTIPFLFVTFSVSSISEGATLFNTSSRATTSYITTP